MGSVSGAAHKTIVLLNKNLILQGGAPLDGLSQRSDVIGLFHAPGLIAPSFIGFSLPSLFQSNLGPGLDFGIG